MKSDSLSILSGVSLALLAAGLAAQSAPASAAGKSGKVEMVHCSGVNACKGHNDCKTADNACAGHGSCKGKGFVAATAQACTHLGGRIDPGSTFTVAASKVKMVHCVGVNACKGHNDCRTASNACKGHGSCKGQRFVALPAASCTHIGGKVG
jgi:hypothetical protein